MTGPGVPPAIVYALAARLDEDANAAPHAQPRARVVSDPILPERLPSTGFLQREAERDAPKAIIKQLRRSPPAEAVDEGEVEPPAPKTDRRASQSSDTTEDGKKPKVMVPLPDIGSWKEPQPYEVFRAIEKKDIMMIMEIRDRAFPLLLRKTGDATPLLHAMRIGKSHRDVAIILLGAFSRWVNHLEDDEVVLPKTKVLLKALRTNLKLAIDYGLAKSQSDLTASFLQTLIMSEGDRWVTGQAHSVSLALRAGTAGQPVKTADAAVRSFATRELGRAQSIATLEDYVANATADLLMMGAWAIVRDAVEAEPIPSYYFARDDRVYKAFQERVDQNKSAIQRACSKRTRWQLRVLRAVLEGRTTTYRSKVELLSEELDKGEGV